jgi:hypothetical protein
MGMKFNPWAGMGHVKIVSSCNILNNNCLQSHDQQTLLSLPKSCTVILLRSYLVEYECMGHYV